MDVLNVWNAYVNENVNKRNKLNLEPNDFNYFQFKIFHPLYWPNVKSFMELHRFGVSVWQAHIKSCELEQWHWFFCDMKIAITHTRNQFVCLFMNFSFFLPESNIYRSCMKHQHDHTSIFLIPLLLLIIIMYVYIANKSENHVEHRINEHFETFSIFAANWKCTVDGILYIYISYKSANEKPSMIVSSLH